MDSDCELLELAAKAADELDRQHAEIAHLTAENEAMRAKLAAPNPADEPVFWTGKSWIDDANRGRNGTFVNKPFPGFDVPLYTSPQRREPLTDEQLWANDKIMSLNADLGLHMDTIRMFARSIEAAHGIGEQP